MKNYLHTATMIILQIISYNLAIEQVRLILE